MLGGSRESYEKLDTVHVSEDYIMQLLHSIIGLYLWIFKKNDLSFVKSCVHMHTYTKSDGNKKE